MNSIKILKAQDVAWNDYKDLRLEALQNEPQAFGSSYEEQVTYSDEEWQKRLASCKENKGNWMVFAADGSKLVGMMGAFQTAEDKEKNMAQVIGVYVKGRFRGNGIGKMLMHELFALLKNAQINKVYLCVNIQQVNAVKLYEKFGFMTTSTERRKLGDGKYYDEYDMEKVL